MWLAQQTGNQTLVLNVIMQIWFFLITVFSLSVVMASVMDVTIIPAPLPLDY